MNDETNYDFDMDKKNNEYFVCWLFSRLFSNEMKT